MLDKVIIITGASSGIGEAIARRLAQEGARLTLAARREDQLNRVAQLIRKESQLPEDHLMVAPIDICSAADIKTMVKETQDRWGRIDVLINNAGVCYDRWLVNMKSSDIHQEVETNLTGVIETAQAVLQVMLRQKTGHIINISSIAGLIGLPGNSIYSATKYGVYGFSEALRREVKRYGIRVTAFCPGYAATPLIPALKAIAEGLPNTARLPGVMKPEYIAGKILDVIKHPRRQVVLPIGWSFLAAGANLSPEIADFIIPLFIQK